MKQDDDDQRVKKLIGEIVKLLPERSKIKQIYFTLSMHQSWSCLSDGMVYLNSMTTIWRLRYGMKRMKNPSGSSISSLISFTLFPFGKGRCYTDCV